MEEGGTWELCETDPEAMVNSIVATLSCDSDRRVNEGDRGGRHHHSSGTDFGDCSLSDGQLDKTHIRAIFEMLSLRCVKLVELLRC